MSDLNRNPHHIPQPTESALPLPSDSVLVEVAGPQEVHRTLQEQQAAVLRAHQQALP